MQIRCNLEVSTIRIEVMDMVERPMEQVICAVTFGVWTLCVNVWEAICAHACKGEKHGFGRTTGGMFGGFTGP